MSRRAASCAGVPDDLLAIIWSMRLNRSINLRGIHEGLSHKFTEESAHQVAKKIRGRK